MQRNKKILNLGCGQKKLEGAVGIDINPNSAADVIHDLEKFPYPFSDNEFDEIYADNVMEHFQNVVGVLEELHRISRNGAVIKIIAPYFRSKWACADPTHKRFFSVESFAYFDEKYPQCKDYKYSPCRFSVEKIIFNENIKHKGLMKFFQFPAKLIANKWPLRYENYLSHLIPLDTLTFYLRTAK